MADISTEPPKGTSFHAWRIDRRNRSTGATCARDEETKQRQRKILQWQTGCSPRPPTSSDWNAVWHGGWSELPAL